MRKLKPQQYIDEFYPGSDLTTQTIRNWIKAGELNGEQNHKGRWFVIVQDNVLTEQMAQASANDEEQAKLFSMILSNKKNKVAVA